MNRSYQVLSRAVRCYKATTTNARCFSSVAEKMIVKNDSDTGIATVYMNSPPVNFLDSDMLKANVQTVKDLEKDSSVRGIIVTSNYDGKVFSGGLNILDMFQKSPEHLFDFWTNVQDWYLGWYGCKKPTVAAINGHAPAGGCALSLMCDYRIMQTGGKDVKTIGLNETQLGITAPFFFVELMCSTVGHRHAQEALAKGRLYTAEEAFNIGMVDKLAPLDNLLPTAKEELKKFMNVPAAAFTMTKLALRQDVMNKLIKEKKKDAEQFAAFVSQPQVQKAMGMYLEMLKARRK